MLTGQCHCGNIRFSVNHLPQSITECNCSICRRYGARYAYFKEDSVKIEFESEAPVSYSWGDKMIRFHHCPRCGCMTHYSAGENAEPEFAQRVAVNTRMCPPEQLTGIRVRHFDGADSWSFLD